MSDQQFGKLVGAPVVKGKAGETRIFNHHWEDPATFATLGTVPAAEIAKVTNGLMSEDVPVTLNKLILDYDHIIICGLVFPTRLSGFLEATSIFSPALGVRRSLTSRTGWGRSSPVTR